MELLVVVGVIAVLLAILLPALARARRAAESAACMANLRSAGQAMLVYAGDNGGYFPGSAHSSGRHLWDDSSGDFAVKAGITINNSPEVIEIYDWIGPLAKAMKLEVPDTVDGPMRFEAYRRLPQFTCPAARDMVATPYGKTTLRDGPIISYATGAAFMLKAAGATAGNYSGRSRLPMQPYWKGPADYAPKLNKIGSPATKVFLADAARWSRYDSGPTFSYDDVDQDHNNTNFSDFGPFWGISKSYDRSAPNRINAATIDARVFAYRHGTRDPWEPTGAYKMNVVFFDGHVETLDDMQSANPDLWLPRGSVLANPCARFSTGQPIVWTDVKDRYLANVTAALKRVTLSEPRRK